MTLVESVLLVTKISLERFFSVVFFFNFNKQNMYFCIVIPTYFRVRCAYLAAEKSPFTIKEINLI